jgi:hypothetical protein
MIVGQWSVALMPRSADERSGPVRDSRKAIEASLKPARCDAFEPDAEASLEAKAAGNQSRSLHR